jgi:predicted lipopolysaccharide heptosyltransferase III
MADGSMKILLIRPRLIGDVVFTTPAIRALRRRFPDAWISYLVEPEAAPVLRNNPHLNEVLVAPRPRGWYRLHADFSLARQLRAARFDLVIDLHGGPRSSWLAWATRAPRRVGYDVVGRGWMYTTRVHRPRELRPRHSVQNQWDLLGPLGIDAPDPRRDPTEMPESSAAAAVVASRLAEAGIHSTDTLIVVHVSAGNPFRRWPAAAFVDLVEGLASADPARRIVITSGPSDAGARQRIIEMARRRLTDTRAHAVTDSGEFNLDELRALMSRAVLYIGGDSGPLHIASTTSVAIVGIYGPTLPVRSEPWRDPGFVSESIEVGPLPCRPCDQRRCAPGDYRCLTGIAPAAVLAAADRALERQRLRATGSGVGLR